jgi:hypothetical protein
MLKAKHESGRTLNASSHQGEIKNVRRTSKIAQISMKCGPQQILQHTMSMMYKHKQRTQEIDRHIAKI